MGSRGPLRGLGGVGRPPRRSGRVGRLSEGPGGVESPPGVRMGPIGVRRPPRRFGRTWKAPSEVQEELGGPRRSKSVGRPPKAPGGVRRPPRRTVRGRKGGEVPPKFWEGSGGPPKVRKGSGGVRSYPRGSGGVGSPTLEVREGSGGPPNVREGSGGPPQRFGRGWETPRWSKMGPGGVGSPSRCP